MNQIKVGNYIANKRREKNLTQEQLSEKIGVSNKTISKWECGRCMPDYSLIEDLCKELGISVSELINGHDFEQPNCVDNESLIQIELLKIHNIEVDAMLLFLLSLVLYSSSGVVSSQLCLLILNIVATVSIIGGIFGMVWSNVRKRKLKK